MTATAQWTIEIPEDAEETLAKNTSGLGRVWRNLLRIDWEKRHIVFWQRHQSENGVPFSVYHGVESLIDLPDSFDPHEARQIIDAHLDQLDAFADVFSTEWNGHNMVGTFFDEEEAKDNFLTNFEQAFEGMSTGLVYWDAGDWLQDGPSLVEGLSGRTTDRELEGMADKIVEEASTDAFLDREEVLSLITGWRDEMLADLEED